MPTVFVATALFIAGSYGIALFLSRGPLLAVADALKANLNISFHALTNLDTDSADMSLRAARGDMGRLEDQIGNYGVWKLLGGVSAVWPKAGMIMDFLSRARNAADASITLNAVVGQLKERGFALFAEGKGEEFVKLLEEGEAALGRLDENSRALASIASQFGGADAFVGGADIMSTLGDLSRARDFLAGALAIVKAPVPSHILVLFQNQSEIRPAGGFIGSFADVTVEKGAVGAIDVHDIYYPDYFLKEKIIPPKPLQGMTTAYGARDANWFFDFPTSAKKVSQMLEASEVFHERLVKFDAVVAINTDVLGSVLDLIGPVHLPDYDTVLTKENFLAAIQTEVEAGPSKAAGKPKRILGDLMPVVMERLKGLGDTDKKTLLDAFARHLKKKDIMAYASDKRMQNVFAHYGADGGVYQLPKGYNGDYLAIVDANVAGGKTDAFMDQRVSVKSVIEPTGAVRNELTVERTHTGGGQKLWLYNMNNKNYLRAYVPPFMRLAETEGGMARTIVPMVNYIKQGYATDSDVARADAAEEEFGKAVFDTWQTIAPKKRGVVSFTYEGAIRARIGDGVPYQFVFEKQSGVDGSIAISIEAPVGFRWKESGSPIFSYENGDPDARTILSLTMEKT
ncbi:MAG: DUF4012 domain-containing protein [Candidatus Liptonbacteria bacterium]|nr:DUF4012 domain-containing protein [Candidatus Liptonbacteria bacterium]